MSAIIRIYLKVLEDLMAENYTDKLKQIILDVNRNANPPSIIEIKIEVVPENQMEGVNYMVDVDIEDNLSASELIMAQLFTASLVGRDWTIIVAANPDVLINRSEWELLIAVAIRDLLKQILQV